MTMCSLMLPVEPLPLAANSCDMNSGKERNVYGCIRDQKGATYVAYRQLRFQIPLTIYVHNPL